MAAPLLFYDLSLLPSSSIGGGGDDSSDASSSRLELLAAAARALELGYAAVALDRSHRGLLADSHRCRTELFPPLSSLPLPPSAALHRRCLASPASEPFRQYTRITLSLDSAAAAASALAPSAARLLRTYDLVAARPLTQAAFDHLCQAPLSAQHLDLISIDFSSKDPSSHSKLPFRIKLPMLKLALQKGLHFEIAYSPLISNDINAKRNLLADIKLLVAWTKGKNLIISSAAHTASQIRGPYDVINLSAYLLGLPIYRAKAAISTNCRSLVLKALRKKHFYKETIRVDRLLPNEQLTSTKFKLVDWIAGISVSSEGGLNQLESSSNFDERPGSPIRGVMEGSHEEPHDFNVSVFVKLSEQSGDHEQIPSQTQEAALQIDRTEVLLDRGQSILPASSYYQNAVLAKTGDSKVVPDPFMQTPVNPKGIVKHAEFVQDAMEVDATESRMLNLIVGDNIPSISGISAKLSCSALIHGVELSGTSLEDQGPCQSSEILANNKSYTKYYTDCAGSEREKTVVDHEIPSGSVVCAEDKDLDQSTGMQVDAETCKRTSELVEWPPSGIGDEAPLDLAFYSSHKLHSNVIIQREVMEGKIEQSMDENVEQTVENEAESIDKKTRTSVSMEPAFHGQEISLTSYKRSTDASCESDELKEQNSEGTYASLEKSIAKTHELLPKFSYPSGKVEMSTIRSEKRRRKLRPYHPAYLPFLGFLRSLRFKQKICKAVVSRRKS